MDSFFGWMFFLAGCWIRKLSHAIQADCDAYSLKAEVYLDMHASYSMMYMIAVAFAPHICDACTLYMGKLILKWNTAMRKLLFLSSVCV